jgi:hypothetical protein
VQEKEAEAKQVKRMTAKQAQYVCLAVSVLPTNPMELTLMLIE